MKCLYLNTITAVQTKRTVNSQILGLRSSLNNYKATIVELVTTLKRLTLYSCIMVASSMAVICSILDLTLSNQRCIKL